jgi:hypothetical protein
MLRGPDTTPLAEIRKKTLQEHKQNNYGCMIMTAIFPEISLWSWAINRLFQAEITAFRRGFEEDPVPLQQDLRAGAVAWLAVFAPEAINAESRRLLRVTCEAEAEFVDYDEAGWYRTVYLHVAEFALSGDVKWLEVLVTNLDHRSSELRSSLHAPLGLVVPRLKLTFPGLCPKVERNLVLGHFYNDSLLCLFYCAQGSAVLKLAHLLRWRERIRLVPQDIETIDEAIKGGPLRNTVIADEYAKICRYLLCRLVEPEFLREAYPLTMAANSGPTTLGLWDRIQAHPLMKRLIEVEWAKEQQA